MRPDRLVARARAAQFVLLGERQLGDFRQTADRRGRIEAGARELVAIEARALEEIGDLSAIERIVAAGVLVPRRGLDFGLDHAHGGASPT